MDTRPAAFERPAVKLAAFACTLGLTIGGGALIGAAIGPEPSDSPAHEHDTPPDTTDAPAGHDADRDADLPEGLAVSRDGYELRLANATFASGERIDLDFEVLGPNGEAVTEFDVVHDKELHLIVVSRDLVEYLHVHPERSDDGTWNITLPPRPAGSYRVFADFTATGGSSLTLGADIAVAGAFAPADLPPVGRSTDVDGYTVTLDGTLVAGTGSAVTLSVSDDEGEVDDLEPYLGALGHLVAIRSGDLAYLHVHPAPQSEREGGATAPGGPDVEFTVEVPTAGTYRLFFDFSHGGEVHSAAFTVNAEPGDHAGQNGPATTAGGDHVDH